MKLWRGAVILCGFLSLAGCSVPVTVETNSITPPAAGSATAADPYYRKLCVAPGPRFSESISGWNEIVTPEVLASALSNVLISANLLASSGNCSFTITANIVHVEHTMFYVPFAPVQMTADINYTITRQGSADIVYKNTVQTPYQHHWDFAIPAYVGTVETIRDTVNGAIAANLAQLVTALSADQPGPAA